MDDCDGAKQFVCLPPEVIGIISGYCGQADVVNLAIAYPPIAATVTQVLYRAIVFDAGPRPLEHERPLKVMSEGRAAPISVVRTTAGICQCLQVLKTRQQLAALVWSIQGRSNIAVSDAQIMIELKGAFANLKNLVSLEWTACPELPLSVIATLPCPEKLETLRVDLAVRPWQKKEFPEFKMPALKTLEVRPYFNSAVLAWLKHATSSSEHLEEVKLCRTLASKSEIGSGYAFAAVGDIIDSESLSAVAHFFPNVPESRQKWQLTRLSLMETTMYPGDATQMLRSVDLSNLQDLELVGTDFSGPFLTAIARQHPPVYHLRLEWNAPNSVVTKFLRSVGPTLRSLRLHVKSMPEEMARAIAESASPMLSELTLVMDCPFRLADLQPLKEFHNLHHLSLPFNSQIHSWEVAYGLPRLRTLSLWNNASGSSNGQFGLITGGLFNEWNIGGCSLFQYAPIVAALKNHSSLELLEIDGKPVHEFI